MQEFLDAGLAASTKKVYASGWRRYLTFTQAFGLPPTPITVEKTTLFVAFLGTQGLSLSSIESYLAALRHFRLRMEPSNPCPSFHSPHMTVLLRGIKRSQAQQGPSHQRLPITATLMRRIKSTLATQPTKYANRLLWAACCVGFFGFLRCSEFLVPDSTPFDPETHLTFEDIFLDRSTPEWSFYLHIKISKTDQLRQGSTIALGSTGSDLCPVAALLDFLSARGQTSGPLFCLEDGQPLRRKLFSSQVQQALSAAGLDGTLFNSHSFRIGAATTAHSVGIPDSTIQLLDRWQSAAFQRYIRTSPQDLASISRQLAQPPHE